MSQIEQGQFIPHDGPEKKDPLKVILDIPWPEGNSPVNIDNHCKIIEAVREFKDLSKINDAAYDTQIEI